jgi:hypothetical protein
MAGRQPSANTRNVSLYLSELSSRLLSPTYRALSGGKLHRESEKERERKRERGFKGLNGLTFSLLAARYQSSSRATTPLAHENGKRRNRSQTLSCEQFYTLLRA